MTASPGAIDSTNLLSNYFASLLSTSKQNETIYLGDPMTHIYFPVREKANAHFSTESNIEISPAVAVAVSLIQWGSLFVDMLPSQIPRMVAVVESSCDGNFTYFIAGNEAQYAGTEGDFHDEKFDEFVTNITLDEIIMNEQTEHETIQSVCSVTVYVYPTVDLSEQSDTMLAEIFAILMSLLFFVVIGLFLTYDRLVERRQHMTEAKAKATGSILSSLFPKDVASRLIDQSTLANQVDYRLLSNKHRLKSFLSPNDGLSDDVYNPCDSEPIADLFPATTVLFSGMLLNIG
jgi:hypothetical protein